MYQFDHYLYLLSAQQKSEVSTGDPPWFDMGDFRFKKHYSSLNHTIATHMNGPLGAWSKLLMGITEFNKKVL